MIPGGTLVAPVEVEPAAEREERAARLRRQRLIRGAGLSDRQAAVLRGMSHGLHNSEIAADLGMTEHSVKHDLKMIFRRLGARDRTHAVAEAFRKGWLV